MPAGVYTRTDYHRRKISEGMTGYKQTPEHIRNQVASMSAGAGYGQRIGQKHTEKTKRELSKALMGNQNALGHQNALGAKRTEEWRRNQSERWMGDKNPNWTGGNSIKYPPSFNDDLKRRIRERDGNYCVLCANMRGSKRNCAHHIDYDMQNSDEMNLITLCNTCNLMVNHDREYWQEYFTDLMEQMG